MVGTGLGAPAQRRDRLSEALSALDVTLTDDDLARIETAIPDGAGGDRYAPQAMVHLDSEKPPART